MRTNTMIAWGKLVAEYDADENMTENDYTLDKNQSNDY